MVPIQTFLALLAVLLMLSGCTQRPPPGSSWKPKAAGNSLNANGNFNTGGTGNGGNAGSQGNTGNVQANQSSSPVPTPSAMAETGRFTQFVVTANAAVDWSVQLKGEDAILVYRTMGLLAKSSQKEMMKTLSKRGKRFFCERSKTDTVCEIRLQPGGGDVAVQEASPTPGLAELVLGKVFSDAYVLIDPKGPYGHFDVMGDEGKKLYESLVVPETVMPSGTDWYRKKGKRVDCYRSGKGSADPKTTYKCVFYVDYRSGEVDEIIDGASAPILPEPVKQVELPLVPKPEPAAPANVPLTPGSKPNSPLTPKTAPIGPYGFLHEKFSPLS